MQRNNVVPFRTTAKHLRRLRDQHLSEKQKRLKNRFIWCFVCVDKEFPLTVNGTCFTVIDNFWNEQEKG